MLFCVIINSNFHLLFTYHRDIILDDIGIASFYFNIYRHSTSIPILNKIIKNIVKDCLLYHK